MAKGLGRVKILQRPVPEYKKAAVNFHIRNLPTQRSPLAIGKCRMDAMLIRAGKIVNNIVESRWMEPSNS
jgi:hypothetical protein